MKNVIISVDFHNAHDRSQVKYFYAFQPEVTIYKAAGGYKMKVEGMDDTIYVRRLK